MAFVRIWATALTVAVGLLAAGCAPASIDGTVGDREFGRIGTAFFDLQEVAGNELPILYLLDYELSCEEFQAGWSDDTGWFPEDENAVVGRLWFLLGEFNKDDYTLESPGEPGTFEVFDSNNLSSYQKLSDGDLVATGGVAFRNANGTVEEGDIAEYGTVTIDKLDLTRKISGRFEISLEASEQELSGDFSVELCDLE